MTEWAEVKDQLWHHAHKHDDSDPIRALNRILHEMARDCPEVNDEAWRAARMTLPIADTPELVRKHRKKAPRVSDRPPVLVRHRGSMYVVDGTNRINLWLEEGRKSAEVIVLEQAAPTEARNGREAPQSKYKPPRRVRVKVKARIQRGIDRVQFAFDVFPGLTYQPLPWIGYPNAKRGIGTYQRWEAIEKALDGVQPRSALDVGCNVGFFTLSLARMGIPAMGVELDPASVRIARFAARKCKLKNVAFAQMEVTPATICLLPHVDLVLCLSVHHHWARMFRFEAATRMLGELWERCGKTMFFETGESEMPPHYNLPPMEPSSREWLTRYLAATCPGAEIRHLGTFKAFGPGGSETENVVSRNLFQLIRRG